VGWGPARRPGGMTREGKWRLADRARQGEHGVTRSSCGKGELGAQPALDERVGQCRHLGELASRLAGEGGSPQPRRGRIFCCSLIGRGLACLTADIGDGTKTAKGEGRLPDQTGRPWGQGRQKDRGAPAGRRAVDHPAGTQQVHSVRAMPTSSPGARYQGNSLPTAANGVIRYQLPRRQ
jgi:hypothetical protein